MSEEIRRKRVTCSLCNTVGHNIRSCTYFENVRKEGIQHYKSWLFNCLVGFQKEWDFSDFNPNDTIRMPSEKLLELFHENKDNPNAISNILSEKTEWLDNLNDLQYRSVIYGYKINATASKEDQINLLHLLFFLEADRGWMHSYDIEYSVPYIKCSTDHIDSIEAINACIFSHQNIIDLNSHSSLINLPNIEVREERIRTLYTNNKRALFYIQMDLQRKQRQLENIRNTIDKYRRDMSLLEQQHDSLDAKRIKYLSHNTCFPDFIFKPYIEIINENNNKSSYDDCVICLEQMNQTKEIRLGCKHTFCSFCIINDIMKKYSKTNHTLECVCPLCRQKIRKIYGNRGNITKNLHNIMQKNRIFTDISDLIN